LCARNQARLNPWGKEKETTIPTERKGTPAKKFRLVQKNLCEKRAILSNRAQRKGLSEEKGKRGPDAQCAPPVKATEGAGWIRILQIETGVEHKTVLYKKKES